MTLPLSYSRPKTVVSGQLSVISFSFAVRGCFAFADPCSLIPVPFNFLELMTGIEPVTSPLPRECSTN